MPTTAFTKGVLACKIIELGFACACVALAKEAKLSDGYILANIVYGGYIVIFSGMIFGFIIKERMSRKLDMFYTIIGSILFVAAGSLTIHHFLYIKKHYAYSNAAGFAGGSLALINSHVLLVDVYLTYKDVTEYTPH